MRFTARVVAQHSALWGIDRWYRISWYVGPGALALLVIGWICVAKPGGATSHSWARPVNLPVTRAASQPVTRPVNQPAKSMPALDGLSLELKNCFSGHFPTPACTELIDGGRVVGRQLASVYVRRAFLEREGKPDLALADYDAALKVDPDSADALTGRAWLRMAHSEYDAAIVDLNRAVDLWPPISSAHYYRGYAFLKLANYPKALADLNEAQKNQPKNADVYLARGEVQQALGDSEAALRDFDEAIRLAEKDPRGLVWRSFVLEAKGRTQEALVAMETALALDPGNETFKAERDRLKKRVAVAK